jgi:hypothetical protein
MKLAAALAIAALALPFGMGAARRTPGVVVWSEGPMVKIRPHAQDLRARRGPVSLFAARNEFEPFQVVVRAEGTDVAAVDVEVSDLRGPQGAVLRSEHAAVYLEAFLDVRTPSSDEGARGLWPDALIPRVDRYVRERRNAFPFRAEAERSQPVWIELYVPTGTPPGLYRGEVRVTLEGFAAVALPVELTVWSFTLPSTSTLPTTFGISGLGLLRQHRGGYTNDEELVEFTTLYTRAALLHRLSTHGGSMAPPPFTKDEAGGVLIDWTGYDREVGPLLDGQVFGEGHPLPGARATTVDLRTPLGIDDATKIAYWREWMRHFEARGWDDRLYHYLWDEPAPADYGKVAALGRVAREADPRLQNAVTLHYEAGLSEVVGIWTPIVNCIDEKDVRHPFCPAPDLPRDVYKAKRLWWYQSCGSHGCDGGGGSYFSGWPSYMVDVDAVANRIMEWLTWKYGIGGELYFNTVEAFHRDVDPWTDILMHGGNGDGTLFYPGRPERIGGTKPIPIESLRLKLIREGLEDYEYFVLLSQRGGRSAVDAAVGRVVRRTYDWERDPAALESARGALGAAIEESSL